MSQGLIQGIMREAPLPDIIQLVSQSGKTGCFHVTEENKRARIYMKDGRLIHAVSHDAEGLDAVYEVALWLDGHYHFEEGDGGGTTSITKSNPAVLMEMHRRMDEWRVISQKITSLDLYPHSTLLPGETAAGVSPREARLLSVLTGYYTVAELAEVLAKPVLNLAKDIYGLVMAGHVVTKGVRSGRRPEIPVELLPKGAAAPVPTPTQEAPAVEEVAAPPAPAPVPPTIPQPDPFVALAKVAPSPGVPPAAAPVVDPLRITKLNAFSLRIVAAAKGALAAEHHDMVNQLHARATQQVNAGEGPEAVKNLALGISRAAVDAGVDGETVKALNAQLKALFNK